MLSISECYSNAFAALDGKSWHTFSVRWCRLYMHEFRPDQCLPFSMTEQLLCADGVTPANSARNLEELRPTCGTSLCQLIDDYFTQLSLERQMKTKQKRDIQKSRAFFRPPQLGDFGDQQLIWSELTSQVGALGKVLLACAYGSQRLAVACFIDGTYML
jgi:hypothetical protein